MPFPLTLTRPDGGPAHQLSVPTSWADVTLGEYVALYAAEPGDERTAAEVLCGLPAGTLGALAADDVAYLSNLLAFAADPSDVLELLPTPDLPDVGSLPYGVLLLAQQHITNAPDRPWLAHGPYLLALYRVQLVHGKYDEAKVAACLAALLADSVVNSYADCSFFLTQCVNWRPATRPTSSTKKIPTTKKSKRKSKTWPTASARCSALIQRLMAACWITRQS